MAVHAYSLVLTHTGCIGSACARRQPAFLISPVAVRLESGAEVTRHAWIRLSKLCSSNVILANRNTCGISCYVKALDFPRCILYTPNSVLTHQVKLDVGKRD